MFSVKQLFPTLWALVLKENIFHLSFHLSTLLRVVDCSGVRPLPTGGTTLEPSFSPESPRWLCCAVAGAAALCTSFVPGASAWDTLVQGNPQGVLTQ